MQHTASHAILACGVLPVGLSECCKTRRPSSLGWKPTRHFRGVEVRPPGTRTL